MQGQSLNVNFTITFTAEVSRVAKIVSQVTVKKKKCVFFSTLSYVTELMRNKT